MPARRGRATRSSRSPASWPPARISTGPPSAGPRVHRSGGSGADSGQPLDEQHAVLARTVVVGHPAIDREAHRLVEGDRALVHGRGDAAHDGATLAANLLEEPLVQ